MERYSGTQTHSGHGTSTSNNPYLYGTALWKQFNDLLVEQFNDKEAARAQQEEMEETKRIDAILQEREDEIKKRGAELKAKRKQACSKEKALENASKLEEIKEAFFTSNEKALERNRQAKLKRKNDEEWKQKEKEEHDQWLDMRRTEEDVMRRTEKHRKS
jgi:hypothetical protein